jgi:hypothetical protein
VVPTASLFIFPKVVGVGPSDGPHSPSLDFFPKLWEWSLRWPPQLLSPLFPSRWRGSLRWFPLPVSSHFLQVVGGGPSGGPHSPSSHFLHVMGVGPSGGPHSPSPHFSISSMLLGPFCSAGALLLLHCCPLWVSFIGIVFPCLCSVVRIKVTCTINITQGFSCI